MNDRLAQNRRRAESFGSVAQAYDRSRPSYPAALVDDLLETRAESVLDVGCGTGKAARLIAERGVSVLGVEIDDRMAEVARGHGLTVETSSLEDWDDRGRQFDLVTCAQAWHWIDSTLGLPKVRRLLRPGGAFVPFWNFGRFDARSKNAMDSAYRAAAPEIATTAPIRGGGAAGARPEETELRTGFGTVERREYDWQQTYTRDEWLALVSTHSDHATLEPARLAHLLDVIGETVDELGGSISLDYRTFAFFCRDS